MATGFLVRDMERRILVWMLQNSGDASVKLVQPIQVRLMSANGDDTDAGTEITGDTYEPVDSFWAQNATDPGVEFENTDDIEFNSLDPDVTVNVVGIELWDSNANEQVRVAYATFDDPQDVVAGDPFILSAGTVKVKLQ